MLIVRIERTRFLIYGKKKKMYVDEVRKSV